MRSHGSLTFHPSWQDGARRTFERVLDAHGGERAWARVERIVFEIRRVSGLLMRVKGLGRAFPRPEQVVVHPKSRWVEFRHASHSDWFKDGTVIYSADGVRVPDGRTLFRRTTFERWHAGHATYFFGYAFANYLGYPFILPAFELLSTGTTRAGWSFELRFPESFHTHCAVQRFNFDRDGLLRRHDYRAPFAGPLVFGAHFTDDYVEHQGIQVARLRRVRPRLGPILLPAHGIYAELAFIDA